jgi:hypothetical protein
MIVAYLLLAKGQEVREQTQPDQFYEEEYVEGEYDDMPGDLEDLPGESGDEADGWDEDNLMAGLSGSDSDEEPKFGSALDSDDEEKEEKKRNGAGSDDESLFPPKAKRAKFAAAAPSRPVKKAGRASRRPHLEIEMETEPAHTSRSRH